MTNQWQLKFAYSYQQFTLNTVKRVPPGIVDFSDVYENSTPEHQVSLRSITHLTDNMDLSLWYRYMDEVPISNPRTGKAIPAYHTLDLNYSWDVIKMINVSLAAKNLLEPSHLEFAAESFGTPIEIERSVHAQLKIKF